MRDLLPEPTGDEPPPDRRKAIRILATIAVGLVIGTAVVWVFLFATDDTSGPTCGPATQTKAEELRADRSEDLIGGDEAIVGIGVVQVEQGFGLELHLAPGQQPKHRESCVSGVPISYLDGEAAAGGE